MVVSQLSSPEYFVCMHVFVPLACLVPVEARKPKEGTDYLEVEIQLVAI